MESLGSIGKNREKSMVEKCRFGIRARKYFSSDSAGGVIETTVATLLLIGGFGKEFLTRVAGGLIAVMMFIAIIMDWPKGWEPLLITLVLGVCFLVRGNKWLGSNSMDTQK